MRLFLVTHNHDKLREYKAIFEPEISIEHLDYEYDEIQADDQRKIAETGAKHCAEHFKKPVVVDDSGIFINALHGFPGPYTSYSWKTLGPKGLIKLLEGKADRSACYQVSLGYCEPG
ncbi:TPA: non-canonical purine NTP pyrophosphatase, partial [Candidatus Woesearchaeota archaeon]|nr:non-canonical purine NTP pyrophosphatase [Candidatus Woesearchaeota archaeon]